MVFDASEDHELALALDAPPPAPSAATATCDSALGDTWTRSAAPPATAPYTTGSGAPPAAATPASAPKQARQVKAATDLGLQALSAAILASRQRPPPATPPAGAHEEREEEEEHAVARREDGSRELRLAVVCAEDFMTLCGDGFRRVERGRVKESSRGIGVAPDGVAAPRNGGAVNANPRADGEGAKGMGI